MKTLIGFMLMLLGSVPVWAQDMSAHHHNAPAADPLPNILR
jgi:hypothetical protein